jgi:hypothetical protein
MVWLGREGRMTGDMGRMHTCGNFDSITKFLAEHGKDVPTKNVVFPKDGDFVVEDYI